MSNLIDEIRKVQAIKEFVPIGMLPKSHISDMNDFVPNQDREEFVCGEYTLEKEFVISPSQFFRDNNRKKRRKSCR